MKQATLKENAILTDRLEYIYVDCARIDVRDSSVCIIRKAEITPIPIASIACLLLGPGTTITHRAIEAISDSGCLVVWAGDHVRAYYATGMQSERSSKNILTQAKYWADPAMHMAVVQAMYRERFPDMDMRAMSLEQLRGAEGIRMQRIYHEYAEKYHVEWSGRRYDRDDWETQDQIQRFLSIGNKLLYNVCHAAIVTLGFSSEIGFIHTGTMRSFVYDIADLYKTEITIPIAFECCAKYVDEPGLREKIRERMQEKRLLKLVEHDLKNLFSTDNTDTGILQLWDGEQNRTAGLNYASSREEAPI